MKERKCPYKSENCWDYGSCEECEWHLLIQKYERKIARLNKKISDLQAPPNYPPVLAYKYEWKPCPFCGSMDMHVEGGNGWDMICHGCGANVGFFHENGDLNGQAFADAWNRRETHERGEMPK